MSIRMVTYPGEVRTALNDAVVYNSAISTGALVGCDCSVSGNVITIGNGYLLIQGRLVEFATAETITIPLAASGTMLGRVYVRADLQNTTSPVVLLYATGATLPALEQSADINISGGIYELELCTFTVGATDITDLKRTVPGVQNGVIHVTTKPRNFDEFTSPGLYYLDTEHQPDMVGVPERTTGWISVMAYEDTITQLLYWRTWNNNSLSYIDTQPDIYVRTYANGKWSIMARLATTFETLYNAGDSERIGFNSVGYLTGARTQIRFDVSPPKLLARVNGVVLTGSDSIVTIRQNGTYLAENLRLTASNCSLVISSGGKIAVAMDKSSGWGGTNNDVISVQGYLRVRFT